MVSGGHGFSRVFDRTSVCFRGLRGGNCCLAGEARSCSATEEERTFGDDLIARLHARQHADLIAARLADLDLPLDEPSVLALGGDIHHRLRPDDLHRGLRHEHDRAG